MKTQFTKKTKKNNKIRSRQNKQIQLTISDIYISLKKGF